MKSILRLRAKGLNVSAIATFRVRIDGPVCERPMDLNPIRCKFACNIVVLRFDPPELIPAN
jgi:hypothetical protein